ncbi:metal-dependent hydrolase [Pseudomonas sp. TH43]|uniref:metal-dependent hydrolase n=1 Tax=Pseudomonas sp. TH43 TaxID=2796407 RepID=UPI001913ED9D|nr:metal-dependent hydrolase [Pseudomonas sp. TH43]MBK5376001.1 metal-dependent hydrolase [Pseudomonas sp. TH43]
MSYLKRLLARRSAAKPAGADIPRRDVRFALDEQIPRYWYRGWPHVTRFFDGLSIMFPLGEKLFIDSVVHFRKAIEKHPVLAQAVDAFVYQEAAHIREHRAYNRLLAAQGAPIDALEQLLLRRQEVGKKFSPAMRLAMTASLEHFTAILSDQLLRHPAVLNGADAKMAMLWRWHAIEETEHKAVAYDVLRVVVSNPLRRYLKRCGVMLIMTGYFAVDVMYFIYRLAGNDGQRRNGREWLRLLGWLFVHPGPLTRVFPRWLAWFMPGFHPNHLDTREALQAARQTLDEYAGRTP